MAFSGYPNGVKALSEIYRVIKKGGKLIMIDINHPFKKSWLGSKMVKFWQSSGDIIRNMSVLFERFDLKYTDTEIGGFGSVHLYIAKK